MHVVDYRSTEIFLRSTEVSILKYNKIFIIKKIFNELFFYLEHNFIYRIMNYIIAGMVHAGIDPSHVNNFLSACYVPPIDPNTIKKRRKRNVCILKTTELQSHVLFCTSHSM